MKRKILLAAILIAIVALGSVGGGLYVASAAGPGQSTQKLIGVGWEGINIYTSEGLTQLSRYATEVTITNPNCSGNINITDLAVIDETGTETSKSSHNMNMVLGPHETQKIWLAFYVDNIYFEPPEEGPDFLTLPRYTVEISWNGRVDRPLTGWVTKIMGTSVYPEGQEPGPIVLPSMMSGGGGSESEMVNFSR